MKNISKTVKNWILVCGVTVLAICLCCAFTACTKAQAEATVAPTVSILDLAESMVGFEEAPGNTEAAAENYSRWLSDHYSSKAFTREQWLTDLMNTLHLGGDSDISAAAAAENDIVDGEDPELYSALTRRYVAQTLVKALDYDAHPIDGVMDLSTVDTDMCTLIYYGYFVPDEDGMVYPDAPITAEEYSVLLQEVDRYYRYQGKLVLAFGDSIMFGLGNYDRGVADMLAEKYGMSCIDYAISGATFGVCKGHSHIPDQIKTASTAQLKPDIILIDGGTNDTVFTKLGDITDGYQLKDIDERTCSGGFEYSSYLLDKYWKGVPVIYIRAHDMGRRDDILEQEYGAKMLDIAAKWGFSTVDIYNDTDFCTENEDQRDSYTFYRAKLGCSDGVHPTALGYAKYYLPLVSAEVCRILK